MNTRTDSGGLVSDNKIWQGWSHGGVNPAMREKMERILA